MLVLVWALALTVTRIIASHVALELSYAASLRALLRTGCLMHTTQSGEWFPLFAVVADCVLDVVKTLVAIWPALVAALLAALDEWRNQR